MATLRSNIGATAREIRIDGDVSSAVQGRQYRIDDEIVTLRSFVRGLKGSGASLRDQWYITRGDGGTASSAHTAGTEVFAVGPAVVTSDSMAAPSPFGSSSPAPSLPPVQAAVSDQFDRVDSNTIGSDWAVVGTWGIDDEQAYLVTGTFPSFAYRQSYIADALVTADITVPDDWSGSNYGFGLMLRVVDTSNYLRLWNDSGNAIKLQTWIAGNFGDTVDATGFAWVAGQTYRLSVAMDGNAYLIYVDGILVIGAPSVDVSNSHLTATRHGLYSGGTSGPRWDSFEVYR